MIPADTAEAQILDLVVPLDSRRDCETVSLLQATGRILSESVISPLDFPHWDNSAMDGYAVRYEDVSTASETTPVELTVVEDIPAGKPPQKTVEPGQAARILTGAMVPTGANTIVIQENTQREGDRIQILSPPGLKAFIRERGTFVKEGDRLLSVGNEVTPPEVAVLAAAQRSEVQVYRRPRVAILSTGNELVTPNEPLQPGQIVDSNQYALASLVQQMGAIPLCQGIVSDDPTQLKQAIKTAVEEADMVLSSGGVSVGDYDYVDTILQELGAAIHIQSVAVKPGKPLTVATFPKRVPPLLYFGLPGNPVSALVSFWRFVAPALRKLSGRVDNWSATFLTARSHQVLKAGGKRETYLWGQLHTTPSGLEFSLAQGSHSSGNLINITGTQGLAVVPIGVTEIEAGSQVRVLWINQALQN
ncbi:molybdopterin molybdotransferase MoeA [Oscillatoria sp. CS-180]|uniref:molybdopterin molybdotransferase MoeA n=1 Tax=Oscillatoria sp. CS-180 TaxID=3021720 RepID=UPI00232FD4A3|nr:gephyrin-like molybdotransferase Glp [Oscillatoria sp. CS-180]MDB9529096.1 molybdopterin molybdotransferase MoeA [Oscillatoria sp. CS-180]